MKIKKLSRFGILELVNSYKKNAIFMRNITNDIINTNELMGVPGCPYCGAISAFALCTCGKLLCTNGMGENICPWCETKLIFSQGNGDEEGFNVSRGRG